MWRTAFAIGIAGLIFSAAIEPTRAAPVAPIPTGVTAGFDNLTDVQWRRCWRDRWGRLRCPGGWGPGWGPGWGGPGWGGNCWRDRWGRLICR
jgi:hypothetical protein